VGSKDKLYLKEVERELKLMGEYTNGVLNGRKKGLWKKSGRVFQRKISVQKQGLSDLDEGGARRGEIRHTISRQTDANYQCSGI